MLTIRKKQYQALSKLSMIQFEKEMLQHLGTFASKLFEIRGAPPFQDLIRSGIDKSRDYGFTNRGPIRFFLETMVALGSEFDTDPQLPDVWQTLAQADVTDQMKHAKQLFKDISRFIENTKGPDNQYAIRALEELRHLKIYSHPHSPEDLQPELLQMMLRMYPEKSRYIGETPSIALIETATETAHTHQIDTPAGITLITALMFALGHGVMHDPLYPWVAQTMTDPNYGNAEQRIERLQNRAKTYLDATLAYLAA